MAAGKRVYCQDWGWAEVQSVSANQLMVKLDNGKNHHLLGWTEAVAQQLIVPEPAHPFWEPGQVEEPPPHIDLAHWQEQVEGSVIHPAIAAHNFKSLQHDRVEQAHEAWEYLFYSERLERSNTGRLTSGILRRFAHIEAGGWWCDAGVDPRAFKDLQPGQKPPEKPWGCFKPNNPREDSEKPGKKIKYEHPVKTDLSIFLLAVPDEIANRIYEKAGVNPSKSDRASGFWYCVWKHNLPVTLTEGAKKAASLLSQGHAAIGLPGIYAGYRSKDQQGNKIKARLHDELAVFATPGREISICFDYETRPKTQRHIDIAISRTGSLLERQGAKVSVVELLGPEKGVDDLIRARGPLTYEKQALEALCLQAWRQRNQQQQLESENSKQPQPQDWKEQLKVKWVNRLTTQALAALNAEKLGQNIAKQLEANNESEVKPSQNLSAYTTNSPSQWVVQWKHNPIILLPKGNLTNNRLDDQVEDDRQQQRQLDRLKQQQQTATSNADAALAGIEQLHSLNAPVVLSQEHLNADRETRPTTQHQTPETTDDDFQTLHSELFTGIDGTSLGESVAQCLETSYDQVESSRGEIGYPNRTGCSPETNKPISQPILQPRASTNQPSFELPIPTGERTEGTRFFSAQTQSDRRYQKQLEQVHQHQRTASEATNSASARIGSLDQSQLEADAAAQRAIASARKVEGFIRARQDIKAPTQEVQSQPNSLVIKPAAAKSHPTALETVTPSSFPIDAAPTSFNSPLPDGSKWSAVRQFLMARLGIAASLIDELYQQELVYADERQNAVFVLKDLQGEIVGTRLYDTISGNQVKGLADGYSQGWFAFLQGRGQLERVVLVESDLAALAAATLAEKASVTMFIVSEQAGAMPMERLQQYLTAGGQVSIAYAIDAASERAAQQLVEALHGAERIQPTYGSNWNEQLLRQIALVTELNQLGERELFLLYQTTDKYFRAAPPQPPPLPERQLAQSEIEQLTVRINALWVEQTRQVETVESMQGQLFGAWSKQYEAATVQLNRTMNLLSQLVAQKDSKEQQLQEWAKSDQVYKAWEKQPRTAQMNEMADVLKLPQLQERLAQIQREREQQEPIRRENLRQQRQQPHKRGRSY